MSRTKFSPEYMDYVKWAKGQNKATLELTNSQHDFAEWLLENKETVGQIGNMEAVFISIRDYLRQ